MVRMKLANKAGTRVRVARMEEILEEEQVETLEEVEEVTSAAGAAEISSVANTMGVNV
jgi:hypothetical protein